MRQDATLPAVSRPAVVGRLVVRSVVDSRVHHYGRLGSALLLLHNSLRHVLQPHHRGHVSLLLLKTYLLRRQLLQFHLQVHVLQVQHARVVGGRSGPQTGNICENHVIDIVKIYYDTPTYY